MTNNDHPCYVNSTFSLIETILWENGGFFLLDRHLSRLKKSADHFSFPMDLNAVKSGLESAALDFQTQNRYKVRLLLGSSGTPSISFSVLSGQPPAPATIIFSKEKTARTDVFLRHKTTNRELYDRELLFWREKGYYEVIFLNKEGEVTEGAITNIIIVRDGAYLTPPLTSGVLPGTYRDYLMASRDIDLREHTLRMDDIVSAEKIFIVNSVIKMVPARL